MATTKEVFEATKRMQDRAKKLLYESAYKLVESQEASKIKSRKKDNRKRLSGRSLNESSWIKSNYAQERERMEDTYDTHLTLFEYLNEYSLLYFDTDNDLHDVVLEGAHPTTGGAEWSKEGSELTLYMKGETIGVTADDFYDGTVNTLRCNVYFPVVEGSEGLEQELTRFTDVHCYVSNPDDPRETTEVRVIVAQPTDNEYDDGATMTNYEFSELFAQMCHFSDLPRKESSWIKSDRRRERMQESVASRFARYRKMYESDDDEEDEKKDDESDFSFDELEDEKKTNDEDVDKESDSDEEEDIPMTAVVVTVAKEDADKCRDEMIDAGIEEDDIEILDSEDEDDDIAEIKIDANSVMALKDYLEGKGIDLEEKIGGEIVDDSEVSDSDEKDSDKEGDDELNLGDFDEDDIDDLFADDTEDSDDEK